MSHLTELSQSVLSLSHSLDRLCEQVRTLGFPSPQHEGWYELLKYKVVKQLSKRPYLVVAVMGGTNTGKSVVFNHLAGERASAADFRAAGTKHPVCLIPPDTTKPNDANASSFDEETPEELLSRHFDSFHILHWSQPEDPLQESPEHRLFWRVGENVPSRLLLLDTPDIDSDAQVNWERAKAVRQTADLLVAVLTEQKYADAAVKRFFREANEAAKPMILLFNMLDTERDIPEIANWTKQFELETGAKPTEVLYSPRDKSAAETLNLKFYAAPSETDETDSPAAAIDLSSLLSELHFETIKSRTLLGALRLICENDSGVNAYLAALRKEANTWAEARKALQNDDGVRVPWPEIPVSLLTEEIGAWWDRDRPNWSQKLHHVYRWLGAKLDWPLEMLVQCFTKKGRTDPEEGFLKEEAQTVTKIVEGTIEQLEHLAQTSNPVLRDALSEPLRGENREKLLERAKSARVSQLTFGEGFRIYLQESLDSCSQEHPGRIHFARMLDSAATVLRPLLTIAVAVLSYIYIGSRFENLLPSVLSVIFATCFAEVLVNRFVGGIKRTFTMFFYAVPERYTRQRAEAFLDWFRHEIRDSLSARLEQGEKIITTPAFHETETALAETLRLYTTAQAQQESEIV